MPSSPDSTARACSGTYLVSLGPLLICGAPPLAPSGMKCRGCMVFFTQPEMCSVVLVVARLNPPKQRLLKQPSAVLARVSLPATTTLLAWPPSSTESTSAPAPGGFCFSFPGHFTRVKPRQSALITIGGAQCARCTCPPGNAPASYIVRGFSYFRFSLWPCRKIFSDLLPASASAASVSVVCSASIPVGSLAARFSSRGLLYQLSLVLFPTITCLPEESS